MKVLVLWADGLSPNLGLRAIAAGAEVLAQRAWPGCSVACHNYGSPLLPVPVGNPRAALTELITGRGGLVGWLAQADVVLDTRSGDSFSDIYGLKRLTTMGLMSEAVLRSGATLVMLPQTIGPFTTTLGRAWGRRSMRKSSLVMSRDTESSRAALSLGRPVDVTGTDLVFALPVPHANRDRDVLLNVSGLLWQENPYHACEDYRHTVRMLLRSLIDLGRDVTLLAHVLASPSPDSDVAVVQQLHQEFGGSVHVAIPGDLDDLRNIAASAQLTIGSRMHACLNSLSVGTPAIPLAYSRKFAPLLADLGWTRCVDLRNSADPVGDVLAGIQDEHALETELSASLSRAHQLVAQVEASLSAVGGGEAGAIGRYG